MTSKDKTRFLKCTAVGPVGVGKTCWVREYTEFEQRQKRCMSPSDRIRGTSSTITMDIFTRTVTFQPKPLVALDPPSSSLSQPPLQQIQLQFWDTAGQERFAPLTKQYYVNSKMILFLFDPVFLTWMEIVLLLERWCALWNHHAPNAYVLLIGTKTDEIILHEELERYRMIKSKVSQWIQQQKTHRIYPDVLWSSVKHNSHDLNIENGFQQFLEYVLQNEYDREQKRSLTTTTATVLPPNTNPRESLAMETPSSSSSSSGSWSCCPIL
jgi:small GTP-binding protein